MVRESRGEVAGIVDLLLDQLLLEAAEKGLRDGVVPTIAFAAHARLKVIRPAEAPPRVAAVLAALVRVNERKLSLQQIRDQHRRLPNGPPPRAIAMEGPALGLAHQPRHAVLAACLPGLAQVEEHPRCSVDALAGRVRRPDEMEQALVLLRSVRERLQEPRVVATRCDAEHATHQAYSELLLIGLDERVDHGDAPRTQRRGHLHLPPRRLAAVH
jgi:hypothetical protein